MCDWLYPNDQASCTGELVEARPSRPPLALCIVTLQPDRVDVWHADHLVGDITRHVELTRVQNAVFGRIRQWFWANAYGSALHRRRRQRAQRRRQLQHQQCRAVVGFDDVLQHQTTLGFRRTIALLRPDWLQLLFKLDRCPLSLEDKARQLYKGL